MRYRGGKRWMVHVGFIMVREGVGWGTVKRHGAKGEHRFIEHNMSRYYNFMSQGLGSGILYDLSGNQGKYKEWIVVGVYEEH